MVHECLASLLDSWPEYIILVKGWLIKFQISLSSYHTTNFLASLFISRVLMERMVEAEYPEYLYVNFLCAICCFRFPTKI